jgi:hypothetical protein
MMTSSNASARLSLNVRQTLSLSQLKTTVLPKRGSEAGAGAGSGSAFFKKWSGAKRLRSVFIYIYIYIYIYSKKNM